jgi:hypothetical protein
MLDFTPFFEILTFVKDFINLFRILDLCAVSHCCAGFYCTVELVRISHACLGFLPGILICGILEYMCRIHTVVLDFSFVAGLHTLFSDFSICRGFIFLRYFSLCLVCQAVVGAFLV